MANLEVADETAERVLGHSLGGLMATYNVSRHRKQKMAALVALEAEILRVVGGDTSDADIHVTACGWSNVLEGRPERTRAR